MGPNETMERADHDIMSQSQPGCAQHFAGPQSQQRSRSCATRIVACQSQPEDCADYELLSQSQPGCAQHFAGSQSQQRTRSCATRIVACQSQPGDCAGYGAGSRSLLQSCADRTARPKAFALCLAIVVTMACNLCFTPAGFLAAAMCVQDTSYIGCAIRLKIGIITRQDFIRGMNAASETSPVGSTWLFGETGWSGDVNGWNNRS